MKRVFAVSAILVLAVAFVTMLFVNCGFFKNRAPIYVGVTYCGNSVAEGKSLIDKVKGYTNLFVLQSSTLHRNLESVDELGDYAVSAGLYFLPYFGSYIPPSFSGWLETAKQKWGTRFLGVYYGDEPGGKMLDDKVEFKGTTIGDAILKTRYGDIVVERADGVVIHYEIDGIIHLFLPNSNQNPNGANETETGVYATFYPNGTIKVDEPSASTAISGQISNFSSNTNYEELMSLRPFKDINEAAERFIARDQNNIEYLKNSTMVFTSDYALFWFDYLAGYNVILAHIGWNLTLAQQIALVRGAAKLQNKEWGIVITWKYNTPPYLDTGSEILNQMRTAYECGAKYFVLFNYYEDEENPYGTMKDEHFKALEFFWNDVVKNPQIIQGSIRADSVLVLPKNYGWGMRWAEDKIWGVFKADDKTQQLWNLTQTTLENHGLKADIVYEDTEFPLTAEYQNIHHWAHNK